MKKYLLFISFCFTLFIDSANAAGVTKTGVISVSSGLQTNNPRSRTFIYRLPAANVDCNRPLMIVLHGDGGTGVGIMGYTGFNDVADTANFIVVYPDALSTLWGVQWNKYADALAGFAAIPDPNAADDVQFIADLIDFFYINYGIDRNKVYATGHSGGGFMAYHLALSNLTKGKIAGIAPVAASLWGENAYLNNQFAAGVYSSLPLLHIHGTNDGTVPFPALGSWVWPLSSFGSRNCGSSTYTTTTNVALEMDTHTFCTTSNKVILMALKKSGLGHGWPTMSSANYNGAYEIWNFLKNFSKGTFTSLPQNVNIVSSALSYSENDVVIASAKVLTVSPPNININTTNSNKLTFQGGRSVELKPGFSVDSGAIFTAKIGGCNSEALLHETFYVDGKNLKDVCGNTVVLRGINKMHIWTDQNGVSIPEMALTGANAVRIVWTVTWDHDGNGATPKIPTDDVKLNNLISLCIANKMIPIVELHDATCNWSGLQALVDYWKRPAILSMINAYKHAMILNIGNEIGDFNVTASQFQTGYNSAVSQLRSVGITVPIMIDAPNCGNDIDVLLQTGQNIINNDPLHNILLSVHTYWPMNNAPVPNPNPSNVPANSGYGTTTFITTKFEAAVNANLPLVVGEIANYGAWNWNNDICQQYGQVNYQWIASECHRLGIGYLAWDFGPGNTGGGNPNCSIIDMTTNAMYNTLYGWGADIVGKTINNPNVNNAPYTIKFAQKTPYILSGFVGCE
jgi:mannan endo-1,4-beta-mannosidase